MIPSPYNTLPGFKTVYSETDLLPAIAICESMQVLGLGNSTNSEILLGQIGDNVALMTAETIQIDTNTSQISLNTVNISDILSRRPIYITASVANNTSNVLVASPGAGRRIYLTEVTVQNETAGAMVVTVLNNFLIPQTRCVLNNGGTLSRVYSPGREIQLPVDSGLNIQGSAATGYTYTIGYFVFP
jgi:hypothetical protein